MNIFKLTKYFQLFQPSFGGVEGLVLSAALSGVGALMQKNAADDAASKQQRIIRQGQEEDQRLSKQREGLIQDFAADNFSAENRNANYEAGATKNEADLVSALMKGNESSAETSRKDAEGNLSGDYLRAKGTATAQSAADIARRAKLMARANAGGLLYNRDSVAGADLQANTAGVTSASRRNQDFTNTRLGAVRNNGSLVGGLLQGIAPVAGGMANGYFMGADLAPSASYGGILGMTP